MNTIPKAVLRRAVAALRYQAHNEAGMSQSPHLFTAEETQQWEDAEIITRALRQKGDIGPEKEEGI